MKRLALLALAMLAAPGCVEEDAGIRLLGAHQMDETCALDPLLYPGGSYNINSPAGRYILGLEIESSREATPTTVGGAPVSDTSAGDFISSEEVLTFQSTPDLGLSEVRIPFYTVVRAGASEGGHVVLDMLPPATLTALRNRLTANPAENITVLATVKLVGKFGSGSDAETNEVTFPIVVYTRPVTTCATYEANGPCGLPGGQDGIDVVCAAATP